MAMAMTMATSVQDTLQHLPLGSDLAALRAIERRQGARNAYCGSTETRGVLLGSIAAICYSLAKRQRAQAIL